MSNHRRHEVYKFSENQVIRNIVNLIWHHYFGVMMSWLLICILQKSKYLKNNVTYCMKKL